MLSVPRSGGRLFGDCSAQYSAGKDNNVLVFYLKGNHSELRRGDQVPSHMGVEATTQ
jgi:hypothetical protein